MRSSLQHSFDVKIRIEQLGSDLGGGVRKLARIDIPRAMWTNRTRDTRNNNKTQTMAFWGYYASPFDTVTARNGLSVLP